MQFCPKCGAILLQKKTRFCCPKCNYCTSEKIKVVTKEQINREDKIAVLREKDLNICSVVTETCPKCGNNKAYYFSAQMRAGDEAETRFFKCTKCNYSWREYS